MSKHKSLYFNYESFEKQCSECNEIKSLTEFNLRKEFPKESASGWRALCKCCSNIAYNNRKKEKKEAMSKTDWSQYSRPWKPDNIKRECLCCERPFRSESIYNRVCNTCKNTEGDHGYLIKCKEQAIDIKVKVDKEERAKKKLQPMPF